MNSTRPRRYGSQAIECCPCVHHGLRTGFGIGIAVLVSLLLIVGAGGVTP